MNHVSRAMCVLHEALTWKLTLGPTAPGAPPSPGTPCRRKDTVLFLFYLLFHI